MTALAPLALDRDIPPLPRLVIVRKHQSDWDRFIALDYRLAQIETEVWRIVATYGRRLGYCPVSWWYAGPGNRPGLLRIANHLVGFNSATKGLQTTKAWDVTRDRIYDILQSRPCRHPDHDETCGWTRTERLTRAEVEAIATRLRIRDLDDFRPSVYDFDGDGPPRRRRAAEFIEWDSRQEEISS